MYVKCVDGRVEIAPFERRRLNFNKDIQTVHIIWKETRIRELNYLSSLLQPQGFRSPRSCEQVPLVANLSQNINLPLLNASLLH